MAFFNNAHASRISPGRYPRATHAISWADQLLAGRFSISVSSSSIARRDCILHGVLLPFTTAGVTFRCGLFSSGPELDQHAAAEGHGRLHADSDRTYTRGADADADRPGTDHGVQPVTSPSFTATPSPRGGRTGLLTLDLQAPERPAARTLSIQLPLPLAESEPAGLHQLATPAL